MGRSDLTGEKRGHCDLAFAQIGPGMAAAFVAGHIQQIIAHLKSQTQ